ncbi:hypothetical protein PanWU01x14_328620 [Parasponia andersonii]|uniref:RNase H type-1 domain-containing protein n=1 Tax=Parasponia andersonii TaxID=3476 RepID=A0A2P5AIP6_PARAD|nr:hypothetical protein PanWU01x14_328620 [Parasponia andersonii]
MQLSMEGTYKPIPLLIQEHTVSSYEYHCNITSPLEDSMWQLPLWPWIKINVDAVIRDFFVVKARVAWNHRGEVVTCFILKLDCTNSCIAEAQAIPSAVNLAISNKWEALVIEADCKEVVDYFLGLIEEVP